MVVSGCAKYEPPVVNAKNCFWVSFKSLTLTKAAFVAIIPPVMIRSTTTSALLLFLTALWCAAFLAAPLLRGLGIGWDGVLYGLFGEVCHQLPDRSFTLLGYPLAVCMRCSAIYFGFLAGLLLHLFIGHRFEGSRPPPWVLAVTLLPMLADVALNAAGVYPSNQWTRTLTGSIAGIVLPLYLVPVLQEALQQLLSHKRGPLNAGKTQ